MDLEEDWVYWQVVSLEVLKDDECCRCVPNEDLLRCRGVVNREGMIFRVPTAGSQPEESTSSVGTREYADHFRDGVISNMVGEVFDADNVGQVHILAVSDAKAVGHHTLLKVDCVVFTSE